MRGVFVTGFLKFSRSVPVVFLLVFYWTALALGTHLPAPDVRNITNHLSDKAIHFHAYAGLGFLAAWAVTRRWGRRNLYLICVMAAVILCGAMDELTQPLTARSCDFNDWIADAAGGISGVGMYVAISWMLRFLERHRARKPESLTK